VINKKLLEALEICLQRVEHGESLEAVLASYPAFDAQLRPLLDAAIYARAPQPVNLPAQVLARQRSRGLALAAELRTLKNHFPRLGRAWRSALTFLSVAAFLLMSSNGLLLASAQSIPGDTLYPLKRSVESTQLQLVSDPHQRQVLQRVFSERRVEETRSLITDKRVENVEFSGVVSFQSAGQWLVSDIPVTLTSQTLIEAGIGLGDNIEVDGATNAAGDVEAIRLSLSSVTDVDDLPAGVASTPTTSGESVATAVPTAEPSLNPTTPQDAQPKSPEDSNKSGDGKGQSGGSHDYHASSEESGAFHSHSGSSGD